MNEPESYANHGAIWLLLPWYANGNLEPAERERVQAHLRVCLLCRKELAEQTTLARQLRHEPRLEISAQPSFERLLAQIQSEQPAAKPASKTRLDAWLGGLFAAWTPPRLAAACASLALALALPFLSLENQESAPAFHTVADPGSLDRFSQNDLRVIFADQMEARERDQLIGDIHGRVVDGPGPAGLYTIRLSEEGGAGMDRALARLRGHPSVVFAEPALPRPGGGG